MLVSRHRKLERWLGGKIKWETKRFVLTAKELARLNVLLSGVELALKNARLAAETRLFYAGTVMGQAIKKSEWSVLSNP